MDRSFDYVAAIAQEVNRKPMSRVRSLADDVVLDRAMSVFWQRGYAATSLRDLARATGLGAAALYHRFADKDGLFVAVLRRYSELGLHERIARLTAQPDPVDAIRGFFDELVELSVCDTERRGCLLVNTALDGAAMSDAARALVRARLGEVEAFFRTNLQRAVVAGRIDAAIDPAATAEALLGTVFALRVLARLDPDPGRLRRLAAYALTPLTAAKDRTEV